MQGRGGAGHGRDSPPGLCVGRPTTVPSTQRRQAAAVHAPLRLRTAPSEVAKRLECARLLALFGGPLLSPGVLPAYAWFARPPDPLLSQQHLASDTRLPARPGAGEPEQAASA